MDTTDYLNSLKLGSTPNDILEEAGSLVRGKRKEDYGDPRENFARIAAMWSAYIGMDIQPRQVADMMALLKIARLASGYHRDSYVDQAGYAWLGEHLGSPASSHPDLM